MSAATEETRNRKTQNPYSRSFLFAADSLGLTGIGVGVREDLAEELAEFLDGVEDLPM